MGVGDAEVVSVLVGNEEVGQQGNHVHGGKVLAGGEVGAAFDEQHIQVRVVDGSEPPYFNSSVLTNRTVVEDGSLPLVFGDDINATDPNSSSGSGIGQYRVLTNGNDGNATIIGNTFSYIPDGNFSGTDTVVLEVNNTAGLKDTLTLNKKQNSAHIVTKFVQTNKT